MMRARHQCRYPFNISFEQSGRIAAAFASTSKRVAVSRPDGLLVELPVLKAMGAGAAENSIRFSLRAGGREHRHVINPPVVTKLSLSAVGRGASPWT